MKFKLDENIGVRAQNLFLNAGHDIHTVRDEGLNGEPDTVLFEACCDEQRCLVTLDLDFSDVTRFPPTQSAGIVVIRVPRNPSLHLFQHLCEQFLTMLSQTSVQHQLWIVELGRIRVHQQDLQGNE